MSFENPRTSAKSIARTRRRRRGGVDGASAAASSGGGSGDPPSASVSPAKESSIVAMAATVPGVGVGSRSSPTVIAADAAAALGWCTPGASSITGGATIVTSLPVRLPQRDVDRGARVTVGRLAVPHGELVHLCVEVPRAHEGEPDRDLGAVAEQHVVTEIRVDGSVGDRRGLVDAAREPFDPVATRRARPTTRRTRRARTAGRCAAPRRGRETLRPTGCRRRSRVIRTRTRRCGAPPPASISRGDLLLGVGAERGVHVIADPMTAEVNDGRAGDRRKDVGVDPRGHADHPQLPARRRQRAEVAGVRAGGALERVLRPLDVAQEQVRLGLGRERVVGVVAGVGDRGGAPRRPSRPRPRGRRRGSTGSPRSPRGSNHPFVRKWCDIRRPPPTRAAGARRRRPRGPRPS